LARIAGMVSVVRRLATSANVSAQICDSASGPLEKAGAASMEDNSN